MSVYMKRDDYELYSQGYVVDYMSDHDQEDTSESFIELDDLIAPIISMLSKKGYKTLYSCSGHPYSMVQMYIVLEGNYVCELKDALASELDNFDIEYRYSPSGNLDKEWLKEVTILRINHDKVDYFDCGNFSMKYFEMCEKHVAFCDMLYEALKQMPSIKENAK